jgi:aconitate hydratase
VRLVVARSFARIHRANLINWGIVPLLFDDPADGDGIEAGDRLRAEGLRAALAAGERVTLVDARTGARFTASCPLTPRERDILLAGGILAHTRSQPTAEAAHPRT